MTSCNLKDEICGAKCTGYEGSEIWKERRKITEKIDCDSCREHGLKLEDGLHDHVNAQLGKKIYNEQNYKEFVDEVICTCKKRGYC